MIEPLLVPLHQILGSSLKPTPTIYGERMDPSEATGLVDRLIVHSTHSSITETPAVDQNPTEGELGSGALCPLRYISHGMRGLPYGCVVH